MNKIESLIYNLVKGNPKTKNILKKTYQLLMSLVPIKKEISKYEIVTRRGFFFGFHDKSPFSPNEQFLLAHKFFCNDNKEPEINEKLEVGFFEGKDYINFNPLGTTVAWNWHQGSMLQWLGNTYNIIYNDFNKEKNKHIAKIVNMQGDLVKELPYPIGAISPGGEFALSYSFERLRQGMPGYGYANGIDFDANINIPNSKGSSLKLIYIESLKVKELFTVADIVNIQPELSMRNAFHFFTHCLFSPSGKRFVFFHRWLHNNKWYTRMISCNLDGNNLFIFPTSGMVSHIAWKDDEHILAYASTKKHGDNYYLFEIGTNDYQIIGKQFLKSDGHPQFSPDRKHVLTDTYADRFRRQYLIVYDLENQEINNIAKLKLPLKFALGIRCDFHPRWNRKGDIICFDSAHTGKRSLCTIKLE